MPAVSLSKLIPIWKVEKHLVLSKRQALSVVLELRMPEAFSLSGGKLEEMYELFNRAIKVMPKGYLLHKQDFYSPRHYKRLRNDTSLIAKSYERKFNERLYYDHRAFLYISKTPNGDAFPSNLFSALVSGRFVHRDISEGVPEFENSVRKIIHILTSGGIEIKILRNKGITKLLRHYFNLGDSYILNDIHINKDHLRIGQKDVVVYNSVGAEIELPKEFDTQANMDEFFDRSFTFPLALGLNTPHLVNTIIRKNDPIALNKKLSGTREKILSMSLKSRENAQLVDEYDHFLSDAIKTGETPIYVSQSIAIWGKGEQLNKAENELNNALAKMEVYTQRNFNCGNLFFGCCPGNAYDLALSEFQVQLSNAASVLFPIETNPKDNGINGLKLSERTFGIPISVDLWDEPMKKGIITNRNMFILGPSGSGKSFFTNHMVNQLVDQGYHITIIDVGGSYKPLCEYKKGNYFEYSSKSRMAFNPFFIPIKNGKYVLKDLEELESLKTLIFTLWKGEEKVISKEEYTILSRCLKNYYAWLQAQKDTQVQTKEIDAKGSAAQANLVLPNFNSFYEYVNEQFRKTLEEEEKKYFDFFSFSMVLRPYYKGGEYDYLLNSPDEFSIADLPFCVFELDEIKDHSVIFPVVALVIMDAFVSKMRQHKAIRKMILIEEAWSAIANHGMANFLKYLYKTVRKFNGSVGIITQELEDIMSNAFIRETILNNADIQIFLDLTKYMSRIETLVTALGLPQSEIKKIKSINKMMRAGEPYKDVYIRMGLMGKVYSVLVSAFEAAMYTTEASEREQINRFVERYKSLEYGILAFLEHKNLLDKDAEQRLKKAA